MQLSGRQASTLVACPEMRQRRLLLPCKAFKRPSEVQPPVSSPQEKTLQSMVETGIRGSIAMAATYALHLNLFTHMHWEFSHIITGIQAATPALAMEAALLLLLLNTTLNQPAAAALQEAVDAVYLHNVRYSLIGAAPAGQRLALEAAAQLSEDLLARGVLLGCSTAWLSARLLEAGVCEEPSQLLTASSAVPTAFCSSGADWLAAAAICCIVASRYAFHSKTKTNTLRGRKAAAAAEAAARQQLLRYEPKAVQEAAAAAAAAADERGALEGGEGNEELVAQLVHGWLGARFVVGQAAMFAAFIATDNLLASFVAGMAMLLVSSQCCEQYLKRSVA